MSVIDVTELIESTIDLQAEFTDNGLSVSVYVDDVEVKHEANYEDMALDMAGDPSKYDDESLEKIIEGLEHMAKYLKESMGDA
jgi:uncharacterized protein YacL (UPF0231 family)